MARPQIVVMTLIILKRLKTDPSKAVRLRFWLELKLFTYWKLSFVIMFAFDASHAAKMIKLKMAMYTKVPFLTG